MAEPSNNPQMTEDVGEPYVASSLDSGLLEKEEEEDRENVDRTEIEGRLEKTSLKASPEKEDYQEACCREIDCTPPLKPVQEVDCTPPLKPVQEVDSTPPLKPVQEVDSTPPLKPVQEVDSTSQLKPVQERDIDNCIYHLKWIMWHEKKIPIVTQNENGPCPLIAISNILLLRGKIILPSVMEIVTAKELMDYIGDMILQNVPKNLTGLRQLNYEQNMHDAIAVLPRLHTGLDVNVKFTGVQDFEYTPECIIFDLLNIPLYHGWLVDPQSQETVTALGCLGYNQIVEKIVNNKCSSEIDLVTEALIAEQFLERTASQLTYHGLCELNAAMGHDELAVLFRNNHFSTILKKKICGPVDEASSDLVGMSQESNELFQLVTDQGFLHEPRVVWETLSNIEGDGMFVDSRFVTVPPKAAGSYHAAGLDVSEDQQISHDYLVALSLQEEQKQQHESGEHAWEEVRQMQEITSDEQLALRLHEEERRHAQSAAPVAAISHDRTRAYAHAQPAPADRSKKGSCNIL